VYLSLESFSNISGGKLRNAQLLLVHLQEIPPKIKKKPTAKTSIAATHTFSFLVEEERRMMRVFMMVFMMHYGQEEKEDWVFELLKSVKKRKRCS